MTELSVPTVSPVPPVSPVPQRPLWSSVLGWAAFALLTALFGYAVWAAIGNLIGIRMTGEKLNLSLTAVGTLWLSIGIALPVIGCGFALWVGMGRPLWQRVLLLLVGLATVSVIQIDIMNFTGWGTYFG